MALSSSNTYEQLRFHDNFLATQGHTPKKGGRYKIEKCTLKILLARFSGEILTDAIKRHRIRGQVFKHIIFPGDHLLERVTVRSDTF